jgi:hypothetical protein
MDYGVVAVAGIEMRERLPHGFEGKPAGADGQRYCSDKNKDDDGGQQPRGLLTCSPNGHVGPFRGHASAGSSGGLRGLKCPFARGAGSRR